MKNSFRLINFPISFFSPVLGFAGLSLAVLKSEQLLNFPHSISLSLIGFTIALFIAISVVYFIKLIYHRQEIVKEFHHPVKISFFPLIAKIFLILSVIFLQLNMDISMWLWMVGLVLNVLFGFSVLSAWISHTHFKIEHLSPAWFIPVVGNVIVPIAGVQHGYTEISWFFFSAGLVWMFLLTTIIFNRIIFHDPLPGKLLPTLFILFAAPAISFIAYHKLTNQFDGVARILYYFALFLFILVFTQWRKFSKIEFYLSWWAFTFPLAAFILATILMFHITELFFFKALVVTTLLMLAGIIIFLSVLTIKAMSRKEICVEE